MEGPKQVAVDLGQLRDAGLGGEGLEAGEIGVVGPDGVGAAAAIEGLPVEVFLDGLGEGWCVAVRWGHARAILVRIIAVSRSNSEVNPVLGSAYG